MPSPRRDADALDGSVFGRPSVLVTCAAFAWDKLARFHRSSCNIGRGWAHARDPLDTRAAGILPPPACMLDADQVATNPRRPFTQEVSEKSSASGDEHPWPTANTHSV